MDPEGEPVRVLQEAEGAGGKEPRDVREDVPRAEEAARGQGLLGRFKTWRGKSAQNNFSFGEIFSSKDVMDQLQALEFIRPESDQSYLFIYFPRKY